MRIEQRVERIQLLPIELVQVQQYVDEVVGRLAYLVVPVAEQRTHVIKDAVELDLDLVRVELGLHHFLETVDGVQPYRLIVVVQVDQELL